MKYDLKFKLNTFSDGVQTISVVFIKNTLRRGL